MLNKLFYFKEYPSAQIPAQISHDLEKPLEAYLSGKGRHVVLTPGAKGTLGLTYLCQDSLGTSFIKSHLPGKLYRDALKRESFLLQQANPDSLRVQEHSVLIQGEEQLYLEMDVLSEMTDVSPADSRAIIRKYSWELASVPASAEMASLQDLCTAARTECRVLRDHGLFSDSACLRCLNDLDDLMNTLPELSPCICHGDLGDRNLMQNAAGNPVVIDWEDSFWGCAGYDYLYWLTFFNHRKYYSPAVFQVDGLTSLQARSIITMILVIKSAISFYNGSYRNNAMGLEDRLLEIWSFWRDV